MRQRHRPVLEELEARILFSADLAALSGAHLIDTAEVRQIAPTNSSAVTGPVESSQIQTDRREIVFVDTGVDHWETLVGDIEAAAGKNNLDVVLIDASRDGIDQISAALASRNGLDAIHIISHGSDGMLQLGTARVDAATLATRATQVQAWQQALNNNADLLLYGCDVAATADGQAFVATLGRLMGADVAASDDLTGTTALGGNWTLEYHSGAIEANQLISADYQLNWQGTLATYTVTNTSDGGAGSLRAAIIAANSAGGSSTITLSAGTYTLTIAGTSEDASASGDLDITSNITIQGAGRGSTTINGVGLNDRAFDVKNGATLALQNLTVSGFDISALQYGGAIYNQGTVNLTGVSLLNNKAVSGGAVYNDTGGVFTATDTVFKDSTTTSGYGGALWNDASMTLDRVSIVNNTSTRGGGIEQNAGTLSLINATVSGNSSTYDGAGIEIVGGSATISFSTIANNSTTNSGIGGGIKLTGGSGSIANSIVFGNTAQWNGQNIDGALTSGGHNVVGSSNGFTLAGTDKSANPGLSALALDGSSGQYVQAITTSSNAYNAAGTPAPTTDQRGVTRGASADIGAYEVVTNIAPVVTTSGTALAYTENAAATAVDSGLTVADGDSTNLASATVSITTGFVSGQDTLAFTNQNGITGSWNSSTGVLTLSGSATLANYQSAMRSVTYVNTSEAPGTATRTVSFIANDGTANSTAATRNITVTAVNDAPILSSGAVVTLTGQFQNDAPPSGAAGTLVSSLVDFAVPAGQVDNVTDPDAGALLGIALTNADTTNGTWWYSINGGTNWNALGAVADNNARLLAADTNTRIYFQPNTNYSGTLASAITFRAWDQTSGSNGSQADASSNGGTTAFSSATDTASLVVAPAPATLIWNTFQGAAGSDLSQSVAVDASGNIYIAGYSSATWGSPVRAFGSGNDGYVAKFDSSGNLLWNTFLGGTGTTDQANGIAVDASGNVYVVGQANATWGTPVRAYAGGVDVFVAKLNASTGALTWNTFLGAGSGTNDYGYGIAVDGSGNIYVDGDSNASWGAPIRAYSSGSDAFVAKLTSAGALSWNTFLGGTGSDGANGIAVDAGGNVYVGGFSSATWGTPARSYGGGFDMMAAKLSSAGALSWNTFMGSAGYEIAYGLALDGSGNLYLSGYGDTTWGSPVQAYSGGYDAIAVKISNSGALSWNTFMGDAGSNDLGGGIALDGAGNLYLTGYSQATWGSPWSAYSGGMDAFAVQLNSSGTRTWNTFLGGSGTDSGNGVAVDGSGNVYVAGYSSATWGSPVRAYSSGDDGFLTKIYSPVPGFTVTPTSGLTTTEAGGTAQFTVVLNTAPTYDVTIGISVSDTTEATVSASSLTFTTANWNTPQTVTVTGVADSYIDGNIAYSIVTAAAVSADANYNGLNASDVALSNTDTNTYNTLYVDTVSDTVDGTTTSIAALLANKGADGKISLREAITAANATVNGPGGADVIAFNIAGGGVQTITLGTTALPGITDAIVIDGWTQPGYAGTPLIAINGINAPNSADGLSITAGGSTVRGLVIEDFGHYGIYMSTGGGNLIEGNYIGTNAAGTSAAANRFGIVIASSANNTIGGTTAASRNLISGNTQDGINVSGAGATGNVILGNYIGTNAAGTGAIANSGLGIALASANNTVGGSSAGARNVISGNDLSGIEITGTAATGNTVAGNYIGLNAAGTAAIANGENGVMIDTGASGNTIGGATAAARNVISGNTQYGVIVTGQASIPANNIIQGNYLGTDAAGTAAVSNGSFGVAIDYAAASTSILDNVISGNTNAGWSASRGGIYLYANGATIQGNIIGLDATGTVALGNGGGASTAGIFEAGGSSNVLIGGTGAGQGNTIAGNTGAGVVVLADPGHIQILRNAIYGNTGLGIDLGNNGVTANDAGDADTGANNLQNFPVPSSATTNGSMIVIAGSLNSTASSYYRIEFFSSPSADASGYGEGRTYLGYANVSTNGSGNATFNTTLSVSVAAGQYVTATATKANATYTTFTDTSEFAQNVTAVAANNAPSGTNKTQTILEDASHTFSTADFGFSDSADSPANNLLAVKITTLPTVGSLTLSGSAVTAGQTITASDIAAGKLAFLPAANANGAAYASFTFQVQDDGGTSNGGVDLDPTPNTFTFNVTAVSDAPVLADTALSLTVAEDAGLPSGAVGSLVSAFTGGISDVDSGAVNGIALVASNETNGVWYYSTDGGTNWTSLGAVNSGSSLLLANNASTRLYFSPAANYNGSSTSALTLRAWDQTSGAAGTKVDTSTNGGTTAFSSATDVVDVTVTPVNDAPVLADTPLTLIVAKNAGAPSGAVGSPVNAFTGGISDVDNGAVTGIALVASNETNGTWYYTTNGGTNWTAVGTVNATFSLLLANNASTRLYFSPTTNYVGSSASALTLRAWDQTSGTAGAKVDTSSNGGATAFSSATDVIDVTVSANNVPPANIVPGAQSTNEDIAEVFSSANGNAISITDADAGGANNQVTLSITNGTLTLAATAGLTFVSGDGTSDATMTFRGTASAINSALNGLSYSPTANYNGSATLTLTTMDSTLLSLDVDTSLKGHYTFENTGALGTDTSPAAGFPGTAVGTTAVNDATRGNVISMAGAGYVQTTGHFGNPSNLTLAAWVNLATADTQGSEVISLGDSVVLRLQDGGNTLEGIFYNGSSWAYTSYAVNLTGAGWHHVAYTFDDTSNVQSLYLDGVAVASTSATASIAYTLGANSFIGKHGNAETIYDFNGKIDDARIYNRALTALEIATLAGDLPLSDTDTVAITVNAVNDAPTITNGATVTLSTTNENTTSSGTLVSSILTSVSWSDIDSGALKGIAVTAMTGNGIWQYSTDGTTWAGFGAVNSTNALLLSATSQVRYVPDGANGETATFSFKAWDQTTGTASTNGTAAYASTASSGGSTAFSTSSASTSITVSSVNDAPVLADTGLSLTVAEGSGLPAGVVGSLVNVFAGGISDVDNGAVNGIALVASNETNGTWYYTTNGGTNWTAVGTVNATFSLLLANNASTRLYFSPTTNYVGSSASALTLRAWDQTSGTAGAKVDTSSNGGATAFSSATDVIDVTVSANNVPPVNVVPGAQSTNEDTAKVFSSANGNAISITDADAGGANNQVTLSITNGTLTLAGTAGLTFVSGDGTSDSTMTFRGTASAINTALNGLSYSPTANYNGSATLTLATKDSVLLSLDIDTSLLGHYTFDSGYLGDDSSPAAGNIAAVVGATSVVDGTRGTVLSLNGSDNSNLQITGTFGNPANVSLSAWVNLTAADTGGAEVISLGDNVSLRLDATYAGWGLVGSFYDGSGWVATNHSVNLAGTGWHHVAYTVNDTGNAATLFLDGVEVGSTSTTASISYTLGSGTFIGKHANGDTTYDFNGLIDEARIYNRVLTASEVATLANDLPMTDTDTVALTVTPVNDAPVVGSTGSALAYTENQVATAVDPGLTVGDVDNTNLASATVSITTGFVSGQDTLAFTDQNGIAGSWNSSTGVLTLSGSSTLANYQTALRSVTYVNTSDDPSTTTRTVSFVANDGTDSSAAATRNITLSAVNDAPVATITAVSYAVTEQTALTLKNTGLSISDPDAGAGTLTVTLSVTEGTLTVTAGGSGAVVSNSGTASVTITGTVTQINNLLGADATSTLSYIDSSDAPSASTTLTLQVSDNGNTGSGGTQTASDTATINIAAVNDAPVATITAVSYAATEQTTLTLKNTGLSISDPDAGAGTLTVTLSVTEGTLTVTAGGSGAVVSNSGTASVTITGTVTQINNLLGADATSTLSYINTSDAPSASATLTLQVSDNGNAGSGGTQTASDTAIINIAAVNDAPAFASLDGAPTYTENAAAVVLDNNVTISDAELTAANNFSGATLTLVRNGGADSQDVFSASGTLSALTQGGNLTVGGTTIGSVTTNSGGTLVLSFNASATNALVNSAMQQIAYSNSSDAPPSAAQINWTFSDGNTGIQGSGGAQSVSGSTKVTIAAVNDAPVATITAVSYAATEQTTLTLKNTGLSISDPDAGAGTLTVTLSVTEGTLTVTAGGSGAVVSNSGTASVTITGTVTQINNLLGADATSTLSYIDSSDAPSASTTLTLQVSDNGNTGSGGTQTASDTATINIVAVNDAPVLADTALTLTVAEDAGVPSGAVGSPVSAFTGGISDVDSAAVNGIAIVGSNESDGTWYYSTNGGSGWTAVGTVSSASSLLLADNASTRLYFAPAANYNGSSSAAVTLRAWDQTSGTAGTKVDTSTNGGSTAFSSATDVVDVSVTSINDAPSGTDKTRILLEDGSHTFSSADFGFTDVSDSPANSFLAVRITTLPTVGSLTLSGVAVSAGQSIAATDITASKLVFSPVSNANGAAYASFTFQVQDDGGSGNGGIDLDQAPKTFTFDVTAVNDAPIITSHGGAPASLTAAENQTAVTTITATDADAGAVLTYTISGADAGYFSIDASSGVLTFTVAPDFEIRVDANNDGVYELTVQVADGQGGFATQALSVSVTNVNEAPTLVSLSSSSLAENTDTTGGHVVGDLTTSDPDAADSATYSIVGGADAGLFSLGGPGNNQLVLDAGVLDFETRATYQVTLRVTDAGGLSHDQSLTVNVSDVNEAPAFASTPITAATQDAAYSYTISTLDPDSGASLVITAPGLPAWMMLTDNGDGTATLSGTPGNDQVGSHGVVLQVSDGVLFASQSFTLVVANINDAPIITSHGGAPASLTAAENQTAVTTITATDADAGAVLTYTISGADAGYFSIDASSGVLTFTVAPDFEIRVDANNDGVYELTVQVADGQGGFATQALSVSVTNVNEAPTLVSLSSSSLAENTDTTGGHVVGDLTTSDPDAADSATYSIVGGADAGLFSLGGPGNNQLVLDAGVLDFETRATYQVTLRVTDAGGLSHDQSLTVNVSDVNEAPAFASTPITAATQDAAYSYTISTLDPDSGASLVITAPGLPAWMMLTDNGDGTATLSGTPGNDQVGSHGVVLQVSDGVLFASQSFTLVVANINEAPVITSHGGAPASLTAAENQTAVTTITATDADAGAVLTYTISGVDAGYFSIEASSGILTFTVAPDFENRVDANNDGVYELTVQVADGQGGFATQALSVTVTNVNEAPIAAADSFSANEDTAIAGNVLTNDTDPEGDVLNAVLVTGPSHGTLSFNADGSFRYTSAGNWFGSDSFSYRADDGSLSSAQVTVMLTVAAVNDPPAISPIALANLAEDGSLLITQANLLAGASDVDGDALTASNLALVSGSGTLADNGNGTWTFSPAANWNGASSFSFVVSDGTTSTANTANLTVTAVNDVPTSSPVTLTPITEDSGSRLITQAELLGTAADIEGDALTVSQVLIASENGTLIDNGDGSWRYTPAANDDTSVIFSYTITDNGTTNGIADPKSLAASASLDITAVNDAPVSADGALSVAEDNSAIGQLPAATDIEGDPLTYALATTAQHGSVSVNNEGSFNYHPDADFNGNDSFSFSITDSHGASHNYGFTIVVTPVNDAPVAADLTVSTMVNSLLSARLPAASDVDGDPISYALLTAASHGTVAVVSSGQFTYRPTTNYAGPDQFTYTVSDGQGGTGVYTATIDVRRTGDIGTAPPSATAPPAEANEANPLPATVPDGKGGAKAGKPVVTPPSPVLPRANPDLIDGKGLDSRDATATRSTHVMVPVEPISRRSEIDAETADLLTVDVSGLDYLWKSIFRTAGSTSHTGDGKVELEPGKPSDDQNDTQWLLDVTPAKAVGVTLSVGVVWWTIRAGGLLASLAASLPAWRGLDVTMILDDRKRRPGEAGNPADEGRA
jgi:VCBS repeat-containing protein